VTADSGRSWRRISLNEALGLNYLTVATPSVGYADGYRTTDGGLTWKFLTPGSNAPQTLRSRQQDRRAARIEHRGRREARQPLSERRGAAREGWPRSRHGAKAAALRLGACAQDA
jgi:hypothetical protein